MNLKEEFYKTKREILISKFKNGNELYNENPIFNHIIHCLLNNIDPLLIIGELLTIIDNKDMQIIELIKMEKPPIYIIKQD